MGENATYRGRDRKRRPDDIIERSIVKPAGGGRIAIARTKGVKEKDSGG